MSGCFNNPISSISGSIAINTVNSTPSASDYTKNLTDRGTYRTVSQILVPQLQFAPVNISRGILWSTNTKLSFLRFKGTSVPSCNRNVAVVDLGYAKNTVLAYNGNNTITSI